MRLENKIALITGAATEFGKAIAIGYATEGADVYLHDFPEKKERLAEVAAKAAETGRRVVTGLFDITRSDQTAAMVKDVSAKLGQVDVLVNTTQGGWHGRLFECREEDWDKAIDRGLKAYFLTCQQFGKEMARRGRGGPDRDDPARRSLPPCGGSAGAVARARADPPRRARRLHHRPPPGACPCW